MAISIVVISLLHYATDASQVVMHEIYQHLYYLPVIVGAYWYGLAGGLLAALGTSVAYVPHIQWTWSHDIRLMTDQYAELVVFFFIGAAVGVLSSAQRRMTAKYRQTAASLERSHRELLDSQEHLRRAERLSVLGQVAAGLAHEIRNPLAGLKGALEIVASRVPAGTPEADFASIAARDAARLDALVNDFLTYARPRDPELRDVDLHAVIEHVTAVMRPEAERRGVRIDVESPAAPVVVRADHEQLTQVLLNVVLNGIQASESGSKVRFRAVGDAPWAVVDVSDQGPGIPPEHLPRIFDPFFTTRPGGTGLGLAISQRIVHAHNGVLEVMHSSPGGTTFRIRLPIGARPAAGPVQAAPAQVS